MFPCRFPAKLQIIAARRAQVIETHTFFCQHSVPKIFFPEFTRAAGKRGQPVRPLSAAAERGDFGRVVADLREQFCGVLAEGGDMGSGGGGRGGHAEGRVQCLKRAPGVTHFAKGLAVRDLRVGYRLLTVR